MRRKTCYSSALWVVIIILIIIIHNLGTALYGSHRSFESLFLRAVIRSLSCNDVKWMSEGANELWQQPERGCLIAGGGFCQLQLCKTLLTIPDLWSRELPCSLLWFMNSVFWMVGVILGLFWRLNFIPSHLSMPFGHSVSLSALPLVLHHNPLPVFFGIRCNL